VKLTKETLKICNHMVLVKYPILMAITTEANSKMGSGKEKEGFLIK